VQQSNSVGICGATIAGGAPTRSFAHGTALTDGFGIRGRAPIIAPTLLPLLGGGATLGDVINKVNDILNALVNQGFAQ
jgi:hypothetical protein